MTNHKTSSSSWYDWSTVHHFFKPLEKPLEIYVFIDPTCSSCFMLDRILKRLKLEYGHYFALKHVFSKQQRKSRSTEQSRNLQSGISCEKLWIEEEFAGHVPSIAIKAAELQGKKAGYRYFKKIQESLFMNQESVDSLDTLLICAEKADIDYEEFIRDLQSEAAIKALECDLRITEEMDVQELPTLVFFNQKMEEEGIKVAGSYPYEIYVQILEEILGFQPKANPLPSLEECAREFQVITTSEISYIYQIESHEVEHEMKKLMLKRAVEHIPLRSETFWRYM
ncbi:dithiol-disulfide isomerase [Pradoshia eiseniae]|uniref:Dithiol-disulfide isomerase n=1 Tax=Pradoshia eiseniae TaxID=2064768 RepID=A0A2S7N095_9BACI|nr:DsbA family protein [Pradoshia eiseniae]PQD95405.1 dithiol-disulfide isomerase [Pradoshia eiseniae]